MILLEAVILIVFIILKPQLLYSAWEVFSLEEKVLTKRNIRIFVLSGIAFFALTLPFHQLLSVFTFSEIRPSAALYPFLGISFGMPAVLGIMVANCISDYFSGYTWGGIWLGAVFQFLYAYIPYLLWKYFTKGEKHTHRMDSITRVASYAAVCLAMATLSAIGVTIWLYVIAHAFMGKLSIFVFLNNFDMAIVLGYPMMIIANQIISRRKGFDRTLTNNEEIIIGAALAEIVLTAVVVVFSYTNNITLGTYDIWNSIYFYLLILINVILVISFNIMLVKEKINKK